MHPRRFALAWEPKLFDRLGRVSRKHGCKRQETAPKPIDHQKISSVCDLETTPLRRTENKNAEKCDPRAQGDRDRRPFRLLALQPADGQDMQSGKAQSGPCQGDEEDPDRILGCSDSKPSQRKSRRVQEGPEPHDEVHGAGDNQGRQE
jgi:hypothetical protein